MIGHYKDCLSSIKHKIVKEALKVIDIVPSSETFEKEKEDNVINTTSKEDKFHEIPNQKKEREGTFP